MRRLTVTAENTAEVAAEAAAEFRCGGLVALPTETVYGLAADAADGAAVARIFAAKGRPRFNPLICHVSGIEMAQAYGRLGEFGHRLAERFWPGPLTFVVPLAPGAPVHPLVTAGLGSVALRAPRGPAGAIIAAFGGALAAPSANRSGRISPTRAEHVIEQLGDAIALILDAGPCPVGLESTIVSLTDDTPRLLRPGGLAAAEIETFLGTRLERAQARDPVAAPGMLASHYAPRLPLRLNVTSVEPGEALLAFGQANIAGAEDARIVRNLSSSGDLTEAAAAFFAALAELDSTASKAIAVAPVPPYGLGEAINDRLARAAAPRDVSPALTQ